MRHRARGGGTAEAEAGQGEAEQVEAEEAEDESPLPTGRVVATVTKHHVYRGAVAGSLDHVWFGIKYTDGSATGRRGEVEAPAPPDQHSGGAGSAAQIRSDKEGQAGGQIRHERLAVDDPVG